MQITHINTIREKKMNYIHSLKRELEAVKLRFEHPLLKVLGRFLYFLPSFFVKALGI